VPVAERLPEHAGPAEWADRIRAVTEVAFHFNAPEKTAYAGRLLRKAYLKGARLVVLAEPRTAAALDQLLWTMASVEFVPHCREDAGAGVRAASPILITSGDLPADFAAEVLVNLSESMPSGFERFQRVIEVVSMDAPDRLRARERWRQYKAAGLEPQRHDLNLAPTAS